MMQTDFTFEDAKKNTLTRLSALARFAENLDCEFPNQGFLDSAIKLGMIEEKIKKASVPCDLNVEYNQLRIFGEQLIGFRSEFKVKLSALWNLYEEILSTISKYHIEGYNLQNVLNSLIERIERTDILAGKVITEVKRDPSKYSISNIVTSCACS